MSKTKAVAQKKKKKGSLDTEQQATLHPQNVLAQMQSEANGLVQNTGHVRPEAVIKGMIAKKQYRAALDKIAEIKGFSLQGVQIEITPEPEDSLGPMKFSISKASLQEPLSKLTRRVAERAFRAHLLAKFTNFQSTKTSQKGKLFTKEYFNAQGDGYTTCGDTIIEVQNQLNQEKGFQMKAYLSDDLQSRKRAIQPMSFHKEAQKVRIQDFGEAWNDPLQKPGQRPKPGDILILDKQGGISDAGMKRYKEAYLRHRAVQQYFWQVSAQERAVEQAQNQVGTATKILGLVKAQGKKDLLDRARLGLHQAYQDLKKAQQDLEKAKQKPSQLSKIKDLAGYMGNMQAQLDKMRQKDMLREFNRNFAHVCFLQEIRKPAPYAPGSGLEIWETFDGGQGEGNDVKALVREYNPKTNEISDQIDEQTGELKINKPGRWLKAWIDAGKILDI